MSENILYVLLQIYTFALIALVYLFFKRTIKQGSFAWKRFGVVVWFEIAIWVAILLAGGFIFKKEMVFLAYFIVCYICHGIVCFYAFRIKPNYLNLIYFAPPFVSGIFLGINLGRQGIVTTR